MKAKTEVKAGGCCFPTISINIDVNVNVSVGGSGCGCDSCDP